MPASSKKPENNEKMSLDRALGFLARNGIGYLDAVVEAAGIEHSFDHGRGFRSGRKPKKNHDFREIVSPKRKSENIVFDWMYDMEKGSEYYVSEYLVKRVRHAQSNLKRRTNKIFTVQRVSPDRYKVTRIH